MGYIKIKGDRMIKIFENEDYIKLEKAVNEYIDDCGSKIESIKLSVVTLNENSVLFHCCIVHDLSFINQYK